MFFFHLSHFDSHLFGTFGVAGGQLLAGTEDFLGTAPAEAFLKHLSMH